MYVLKANGEKEEFSRDKITNTCVRAGLSKKEALKVAKKVESSVKEGTRTRDIYEMILHEIDKTDERSSFIFRIRESLAEINPTSFEIYVEKILQAYGYKCEWNKLIMGKYVEHQVDIIAAKEETYLVEVKRHSNPHRFTGLGDCLQVQARLDDIKAGNKERKNNYKFSGAWIITNTKFSDHAKKYSKGIGLRLSGWGYQGNFSLDSMINNKRLFPVTILKINNDAKRKLLGKDIITIQDLTEIDDKKKKKLGIPEKELQSIFSQAKKLLM